MPDDEKQPKKIEHHIFDFSEPGDRAAAEARHRAKGPATFQLNFDRTNPTFALLNYGPLTLTFSFLEVQALAEALTGLHAKMVEVRAELEQAEHDRQRMEDAGEEFPEGD